MSVKKIISYQEVYNELEKRKSKFQNYDCIIGISRDGIIPATMLSYIIHKPLFIANINREEQKIQINGKPFGKILIIDDVWRTGGTINILKRKFDGDTLVLITDYPEKVNYRIFEENFYYICEWEKEDEQEQYTIGYDLDGIICRDLKPNEKRLTSYPKLMLWYKSFFKKLHTPEKEAIIITGRPECDKEATIKRLRKNGIYNRIEFNKRTPNTENAIKTKIWGIKKFGLKKFYESDKHQIKEIKSEIKDCEILHLNNNRKGRQ